MQLLSGFVGTSGGFAGLVLPLSRDNGTKRVFSSELTCFQNNLFLRVLILGLSINFKIMRKLFFNFGEALIF